MKTRKRLLSIALALLMVLTLLPATALQAQAAGVFAGGSGTPEDPYRIATAEQLDTVRNYRDKHFVLTADITLTENWMPIGPSSNKAFTGTFDGNWHTISGLAISGPGHTYYGLFGYIAGAEICNLSLQNVEIDAQYEYGSWVGGLTGYATGNSIIENCYIEGSVSGTSQSKTGGLAGSVVGAAIIQCFVDVNVTSTAGNAGAGGLAASLSGKGSRITNSYAVGSVTGYYAGGMVGVLEGAASVENSYAVGAVSSESGGGGLVGMKSGTGGQVTDSYYDKETTGWTNSPAGTGKSTKEMQTATPFSNWNTSIWHFEAGKYPALYYQLKQYRVTYNLNGNHGSVPADANTYCGFDSVTAAASDGLTPPEGKAFKEWNTKSDGSGVAYAAGGTFGMPGGDRTLFAIWDTLHAVSYDLNAGSGTAPSSEQHFAGDTFTAADAAGITAPAGKRFLEWNTTENGDGTAYKSGDSVTMPAANLTLYAIWEKYQDGSEEHPFLVNDYEDMYAVRDGLGLHYRQTADITLPDSDFDYEEIEDLPSYSNWAPLGYEWNPDTESYDSNPFTGSYDGGGYTISNLIIDTDAFQFAGLFGYIADGAELKNICLADVEIVSSFSHDKYPGCAGALAGYNEGTITACASSGYLSGSSGFAVGGVAGINEGRITDCAASGCLSSGEFSVVGGIAGYNEGEITACSANGCLAGGKDSFVGGIAGYNEGVITAYTDNTTRAQAETLFFVEEDGIFYIGDPAEENEASELGGWSYDSGAAVLTLDNLTWMTLSPQALVILPDEDDNLTIRLAPGSENSFISLFYGRDLYSCGLEVKGSLAIDGTGTLTTQSGTSKDYYADGLYVWKDLLINGGTVTTTGSTQAVASDTAVTVNIAGGYRYWTNTSASASGAVGPVNSTATPFVNSDTYKYIRIAPGLKNENTPTSPTSPAYNAEVSDGGKLPVTVNTGTGRAFLDLSSLSQRLADGRNTVVTAPPVSGVSSYTASLPSASLSGSGAGSLTLSTGAGSVTIPGNMLSGTGLKGNSSITIGSADTSSLPETVQTAIGNRPLISLILTMDGKPVEWSNPDASVTIAIPYTPTAEELLNPESIVIWYIDGSGNVVAIPAGRYDPASGTVTFSTTHFSDYAVSYNPVSFNDVAEDAWYNKAVGFLAAREITTGTGKGNYSPEAELTRGDFMVLLMRAYGISPDFDPGENFADAGNTYYTGYLAAAKRLGLSNGVGNNRYAPELEITRQEMFTLLYNILKSANQLPQGESSKTISDFTDAGQIDVWAREALTLLVETGVVRGNNGALMPLNTTTRAEMAQVLYSVLGK